MHETFCPNCGNYYPTTQIKCPNCITQIQPKIDRLAEFDKEIATITHRRGNDYGDPVDNFTRINNLKSIVADCPHPLVRHVLEVMCIKIARLVHNPAHLDSWIDMVGYARCGVMVSEPPVKMLYGNELHAVIVDEVGVAGQRHKDDKIFG